MTLKTGVHFAISISGLTVIISTFDRGILNIKHSD